MKKELDLQILSLNLAGYAWKVTNVPWKDRLQKVCRYINKKTKNPFIIGLQEVQLAGGKYLEIIREEFPNYQVVLPKGYKQQPKSVVSLMLLNKDMYTTYSVGTFEDLEENLRYNMVTVNALIGKEEYCFRILNVHMPHLCNQNRPIWYQHSRENMRGTFETAIMECAQVYSKDSLIILGDLNANSQDELIQNLVYSYNSPMLEVLDVAEKPQITWANSQVGGKDKLDYILYSKGLLRNTGIRARRTEIDDTTILEGLSDHAMLIGRLIVNAE